MERRSMLVEGMVAGALGYLVVAGFFALINVATGHSPFQTAYLVGEALGARGPGPNETIGVILAANGLHVVISVLVGMIAAWLMMELEHHHALWYGVLLAFLGGFVLSVVAGGILAAEVTEVATWEQITVANALGAIVIGAYLWRTHRELMDELSREYGAMA